MLELMNPVEMVATITADAINMSKNNPDFILKLTPDNFITIARTFTDKRSEITTRLALLSIFNGDILCFMIDLRACNKIILINEVFEVGLEMANEISAHKGNFVLTLSMAESDLKEKYKEDFQLDISGLTPPEEYIKAVAHSNNLLKEFMIC